MNKKGFTLIELIIVIVILAIVGGLIHGCISSFSSSTKQTAEKAITFQDVEAPAQRADGEFPAYENSYEAKLRKASAITITEKMFSWGKSYVIYVNNEEVASVNGKDFRIISGDVFKLTTKDGKLLAYEEECRAFFAMNRSAVAYDAAGNITGYFGEESGDWFSWGYIFHFYDQNKQEIGLSQKIGKSCLNNHKLYDAKGYEDFDINKLGTFGGDSYILTRKDFDSSIPLDFAIFMVCIEDAIADAHDD